MNIILLGPAGTGKGTIAQYIRNKYGPVQISSGDLLRQHVQISNSIGKAVERVMQKGDFVQDEIVTQLVDEEIGKKLKTGFILDGYPRNVEQAEMLDELLKKHDEQIDVTMLIETDEELIFKRLTARKQCEKCKAIFGLDVPPKKEGVCDKCGGKLITRDDDKPDVLGNRLKLYRERTKPVAEYYKGNCVLKIIDGSQKIDKIFADVDRILSEIEGE